MPKRFLLACTMLALAGEATLAAPKFLGPETIADLAEKVAPAVVSIDIITRQANPMADLDPFFHQFFGRTLKGVPPYFEAKGVGSGFIVDSTGLIVTNHHVTRQAKFIQVTMPDGRSFEGRVLANDPGSDLSLVKISAAGLPCLPLAEPKRLRVGEWVLAIGSPLGLSTTVTAGIVSAMHRDVTFNERVSFIQTDAPINPGNSGGPLINLEGQVVGVNTAIAVKAQGIGFAIPAETVDFALREYRKKGKIERPWLGAILLPLNRASTSQLAQKTDPGVLIRDVAPDSPAFLAGLLPGDVILQFDRKPVGTPGHVMQALGSHSVGDTIALLISREGTRKELSIILQALPVDEFINNEGPPSE